MRHRASASSLPPELSLAALSFCDVRDLAACAQVCRQWRAHASDLRSADQRFAALRPFLLVLAHRFPALSLFRGAARASVLALFFAGEGGKEVPDGANAVLRSNPALKALFARKKRQVQEKLRFCSSARALARDAALVALLSWARRVLAGRFVVVPLAVLPSTRRAPKDGWLLAATRTLGPALAYGAAAAVVDHAAGRVWPRQAPATAAGLPSPPSPSPSPSPPTPAAVEEGCALAVAVVHSSRISEPEAERVTNLRSLLVVLTRRALSGERQRRAYRLANRTMECCSQEMQWRYLHPGVASAVSVAGTWSADRYLLLDGVRRLLKGAYTLAGVLADRVGGAAAGVPPEAQQMATRAAWRSVAAGALMVAGRRQLVRAVLALGDRAIFPVYNLLTMRQFEYAASRVESGQHSFFRARADRSDPATQWLPRNLVWSWLVLHKVRSRRNLRWFAMGAIASHAAYYDPVLRNEMLCRAGFNRVHSFLTGLYLLRVCLRAGLAASCAANVAMHLALWGTREALGRRAATTKLG